MPGSDRRKGVSTGLLLAIVVLPVFVAFVGVLVGIIILAVEHDPPSTTLNGLATSFGIWVIGGGLYALTREIGR